MIINTSGRTDTVQYYTEWLLRRLEEKYVLSHNPLFTNNLWAMNWPTIKLTVLFSDRKTTSRSCKDYMRLPTSSTRIFFKLSNGCKYCYANTKPQKVQKNYRLHDPASPLLLGYVKPEDKCKRGKNIAGDSF